MHLIGIETKFQFSFILYPYQNLRRSGFTAYWSGKSFTPAAQHQLLVAPRRYEILRSRAEHLSYIYFILCCLHWPVLLSTNYQIQTDINRAWQGRGACYLFSWRIWKYHTALCQIHSKRIKISTVPYCSAGIQCIRANHDVALWVKGGLSAYSEYQFPFSECCWKLHGWSPQS